MKNKELAIRAFEEMPIGVLILDLDGTIVATNSRAAKILDLSSTKAVDLSFRFAIWHTEYAAIDQPMSFEELLDRTIGRGESILNVRYALELSHSEPTILVSNFSPLTDSDNQRNYLVATLGTPLETNSEEEERKRLEEQLRRAQRMESIGRLAGGVAHNLNNILSPIIGYTDMALDTLHSDNPLYAQMEEIRNATCRATDLVKQLLAFGRKQAFELRELNLSQVVSELETILRQTIREDIDLVFKLNSRLGHVRADLSQIQQIIVNLALNACEAMPDGGRITLATSNTTIDAQQAATHRDVQPGPHVLLAVSDTGHGMDQETLSHVFEPFFTTKETSEGAGLGLATVYGIVKQHGGHIRVESAPGRGATFQVLFPRYLEKSPRATKSMPKSTPGTGQETILVVEDEESLLRFTCIVLRKLGYHVLEASDGSSALTIGEKYQEPIHLLLTDVIMPEMNGKELYQRLSKSHPEMKILYTSGYPDNVIARHGVLDPGENLLPKPTTVDKLTLKVREILST